MRELRPARPSVPLVPTDLRLPPPTLCHHPYPARSAVNEVLEADIGKMHGLTLKTFTPAAAAAAGVAKAA